MKLACVGNALYNIIDFVDTDFSAMMGIYCGSTMYLNSDDIEHVVSEMQNAIKTAGGGAANTARFFSALGGQSCFAGAVGTDLEASKYEADLSESGVKCYLQKSMGKTGKLCAMIDPQSKRSIALNTGVSSSLDTKLIPEDFFEGSNILYIDGFLTSNKESLFYLLKKAKDNNIKIALDVGSARNARKCRDFFLEIISTYCDYSFMNEDEFIALSDIGVEEGLALFSSNIPGTVIVKRAESGSVCVSDGRLTQSAVRPILATDKTGAGDAFVAGFLYSVMQEQSLAVCLRTGNFVAGKAIETPGFAINTESLRKNLKEFF